MNLQEYIRNFTRFKFGKKGNNTTIIGYFSAAGRAKNEKWYPIHLFATSSFDSTIEITTTFLQEEKERLIEILIDLISNRIGIKEYHGWFKFGELIQLYLKDPRLKKPLRLSKFVLR